MVGIEKEGSRQEAKPFGTSPEPAEESAFEADYEEDRSVALRAERQREFQRRMRGRFVDVELPPV